MEKIKYIKAADYKISERFNLKKILKNIFLGLVIVTILLMLCSIIFTYSNLNVQYVSIAAKIILYFSALSIGICSSYKAKSNGWLIGGISSAVYIIILAFARLILTPANAIDISALTTAIVAIFCGVIGGILGINIKIKK